MRSRASLRRPPRAHGFAFYLLIALIASVAASLAVVRTMRPANASLESARDRVLTEARALVLAHLTSPEQGPAARRIGSLGAFPDLPIAAGAGADAVEPSYDGLAEATGCAWRGWAPGAPLRPVNVSGVEARCFGRLPWRTLGLSVNDAEVDPDGRVPWLVVSPNLAALAACMPDLTPLIARTPYAGYACPSDLPYPWIRVRDERGNLVADRVAFALVQPGPPVGGQVRGPASAPSAWLDSITVRADCSAPCVPGTYDNAAALDPPNGTPTTLIRGPSGARQRASLSTWAEPVEFNDRVTFVTIDDLLAIIEPRARAEMLRRLTAWRSANTVLPFAAPLNDASATCANGNRLGHVPVAQGGCADAPVALPSWLTDSGWHRYFVYAVSSGCVRVAAPAGGGGGTGNGGGNNGNGNGNGGGNGAGNGNGNNGGGNGAGNGNGNNGNGNGNGGGNGSGNGNGNNGNGNGNGGGSGNPGGGNNGNGNGGGNAGGGNNGSGNGPGGGNNGNGNGNGGGNGGNSGNGPGGGNNGNGGGNGGGTPTPPTPPAPPAPATCGAPGITVGPLTGVHAVLLSPRAPIVAAPFAPSRLTVQRPLTAGLYSSVLADWVDSAVTAAGAPNLFEPTQGAPVPSNDRLDLVQ